MAEVGPGWVLDGKYEVLAEIGRGGMATVWLGRDRRLDKLWAIKEIGPSDGSERARALRQAIIDEANFMKELDHPAIPRVVDIVDTSATAFVVMDYVDGRSLGGLLGERKRPFGQRDVIAWGIQLCDVLGYLHSRRPPIVYRDMKPANVMLRDDGSLRLVDFGIAMEWEPGSRRDAHVFGTPGYSAPEQLDPLRASDPRCDIYALGMTLYSLVSGHVPHLTGEDDTMEVDFVVRPIREWDPRLSEGLERIIARAVLSDPDARYQSVAEMRYDLEHYELLTREHREAQLKKVRTFRLRAVCALVAASVGVGCVAGSVALRSSTYGAYLHMASMSEAEEMDGAPSAAETACAAAIETDPARTDAYRRLVETYKLDLVFTPTEASRWTALFATYGRQAAGDDAYARLCFEVGVLYLCYYDVGDGGPVASASAASVANVRRSAEWFARARAAADAGAALDDATYRAAGTYLTIAEFHDKVSQATYEGAGGATVYRAFWDALAGAVSNLDARDEAVVRLRLYQVAYEAIAAPSYLRGFWRSGIPERSVSSLLSAVVSATESLAGEVAQSEAVLAPIYEEIIGGAALAAQNVATIYASPAAVALADALPVGEVA